MYNHFLYLFFIVKVYDGPAPRKYFLSYRRANKYLDSLGYVNKALYGYSLFYKLVCFYSQAVDVRSDPLNTKVFQSWY